MFVSQSHLPQMLDTGQYCDQSALDLEKSRLLLPGWHGVGTTAELPRDGDYFTFELLGHPLMFLRDGQQIRCFLNSCPHRLGLVRHDSRGRANPLRCQNHGWTFDRDGTRQSPGTDQSREGRDVCRGAALRAYRTEQLGQLIFVTLNDAAPSLAEYLGERHDELAGWYGDDRWSLLASRLRQDEVNWKVFVENGLESYHIDSVHARTFVHYPPAEACHHELEDQGSVYATTRAGTNWLDEYLNPWVHRLAGEQMGEYTFYTWHHFPHLMFTHMGVFSWVECVLPVSPSRTQTVFRLFTAGGARGWWGKRMMSMLLRTKLPFFKQVAAEDSAVLTAVQRGKEAPGHPGSGLISIREERVFHFQRYLQYSLTAPDGVGTSSCSTQQQQHQGDS